MQLHRAFYIQWYFTYGSLTSTLREDFSRTYIRDLSLREQEKPLHALIPDDCKDITIESHKGNI